MRPKRRFALGFVAALFMSTPGAAFAQSDEDRAAAQTLFDAGQKLIEDGDTAGACEKFQASQELDPSIGTQLNLGDCYEKLGKTASAWINFTEVADTPGVDERRRDYAKERAEELATKLVRLTIEVPDPSPGMTIQRGDQDVAKALWGTAVPVDPGSYDLVVKAPERLTWRESVDVTEEGETITVTVPALVVDESAPDEPVEPTPSPDEGPDEGGGGQQIAGITLLAVGGAGVVIGAVLAGMSHSKASESKDFCLESDDNMCTQEGVDLRESAQGLQIGYVAAFAVGGAAAVAGLVTLLTADDGGSSEESAIRVTPMVGPRGAYLGLSTSF